MVARNQIVLDSHFLVGETTAHVKVLQKGQHRYHITVKVADHKVWPDRDLLRRVFSRLGVHSLDTAAIRRRYSDCTTVVCMGVYE